MAPGARPFAGGVAGFFQQLALAAQQRVFAHIQLAGRELDHVLAHGVAKLPLHHHAAIVQQRHDHHRARVALRIRAWRGCHRAGARRRGRP
jgi:hypothetical protein